MGGVWSNRLSIVYIVPVMCLMLSESMVFVICVVICLVDDFMFIEASVGSPDGVMYMLPCSVSFWIVPLYCILVWNW